MKKFRQLFNKNHEKNGPTEPPAVASAPVAPSIKEAQQRVLNAQNRNKTRPSVLFFTTHKCASTFVSALLDELANQSDYENLNYESAYWELGDQVDASNTHISKFLPQNYDVLFRRHGEIYGPLRFAVDFPGRDKFKHIFFFRDPRDVLVSMYYSFGFTHPEPINSEVRQRFLKNRAEIQALGIDEYVLKKAAENIIPRFERFRGLAQTAPGALFLTYDEFSQHTDVFLRKVTDYLEIDLSEESIEKLSNFASPIQKGAPKLEHKRSGKSGQWKNELKPETADELNRILAPILDYWGF